LQIEVICIRSVWLLNANYLEYENYLLSDRKLIYNWEDVAYFAFKYGFKPNVIDVLFSTQTIRPLNLPSKKTASQWVIEPACWEIFFLELIPERDGFSAIPRSPYLSVIVWTGQPKSGSIPQIRAI
jgi:hypothetical protein